MVLTQRKGPPAWNWNHNHDKKEGRKERKYVCGCAHDKETGRGRVKDHTETSCSNSIIQFWRRRKRGQIRVSERLILICDWLGETETESLYRKSQQRGEETRREEERKHEERRREALQCSLNEAFTIASHDCTIYSALKSKKPISMPFPGSIHVENKGSSHAMVPEVFKHSFFDAASNPFSQSINSWPRVE